MVQGIERFRIEAWGETAPYLQARIALAPDTVEADIETDALQRNLRDLTQEVMEMLPRIPQQTRDFLGQVEDPRYLAYLVAANARLNIPEVQQMVYVLNITRLGVAHMASRTKKFLAERLRQLEARLVQIDESQNKLRGSTDYEDRRQRASLILEGEEIATELLQLRSAVAPEQGKT